MTVPDKADGGGVTVVLKTNKQKTEKKEKMIMGLKADARGERRERAAENTGPRDPSVKPVRLPAG